MSELWFRWLIVNSGQLITRFRLTWTLRLYSVKVHGKDKVGRRKRKWVTEVGEGQRKSVKLMMAQKKKKTWLFFLPFHLNWLSTSLFFLGFFPSLFTFTLTGIFNKCHSPLAKITSRTNLARVKRVARFNSWKSKRVSTKSDSFENFFNCSIHFSLLHDMGMNFSRPVDYQN